jgi:hypothetical protein
MWKDDTGYLTKGEEHSDRLKVEKKPLTAYIIKNFLAVYMFESWIPVLLHAQQP